MENESSNQEILSEISHKLDRIIAMLAVQGKELDDQIKTLKNLGMDWKLIGDMTGMSVGAAKMRYSRKGK